MKLATAAVVLLALSANAGVEWTEPGEIRVVVVGRDHAALAGVVLQLSAGTDSSVLRRAVTDRNGRAAFLGVAPGEYILKFQLSGFTPCAIGPVKMRSNAEPNPQLPEFRVVMNPIRWDG